MPTVTWPMPDHESSQVRSAWSARSYESIEHPAKPRAARRSWPRWSEQASLHAKLLMPAQPFHLEEVRAGRVVEGERTHVTQPLVDQHPGWFPVQPLEIYPLDGHVVELDESLLPVPLDEVATQGRRLRIGQPALPRRAGSEVRLPVAVPHHVLH